MKALLSSLAIAVLVLGSTGTGCESTSRLASPVLRLRPEPGAPGPHRFEVVGLDSAELHWLGSGERDFEEWVEFFRVQVRFTDASRLTDTTEGGKLSSPDDLPPMAGSYRVDGETLSFAPRFPLSPGMRYVAELASHGDREAVRREFLVPAPRAVSETFVSAVYPTSARLPLNQLKFYIHFSAPMARGRTHEHIRLLNAADEEVELPFLELDEELWDPEQRRFTVFFDPGRVKRELKPREEVGPVLAEGGHYTLVIDRDLEDARGQPLTQTFKKAFQVGPADYDSPSPDIWKLDLPRADSLDPLVVDFPEPLDHALLYRLIWVEDADGEEKPGRIEVLREETRWRFSPSTPWHKGKHALAVGNTLEDLAGNGIGRPFEVDVFVEVRSRVEVKTVRLAFDATGANQTRR